MEDSYNNSTFVFQEKRRQTQFSVRAAHTNQGAVSPCGVSRHNNHRDCPLLDM